MAQGRRWCFTLNNPTEQEQDGNLELGQFARGWIFQLERGAEGTQHYQGYVEFSRPVRLGYLKTLVSRAHWELARGSRQQCIDYCSKDDTRIGGPWRRGLDESDQGRRSDLAAAASAIRAGQHPSQLGPEHDTTVVRYYRGLQYLYAATQERRNLPSMPECIYCFGPTGTGKSQSAQMVAPTAYRKPDGQWWDGYGGERTVVWDEFRGSSEKLGRILQIVDRYPLLVPYKGGYVNLLADTFIFTSNVAPWQLWKVRNLEPWYRRITLIIVKLPDSTFFYNSVDDCMREHGEYVHEDEN